MEQDMISKKELLERYSISYGALYRWKRKGLIPEDWFIKKSTVTGQETFFPRKLICQRVELIKSQKEEVLLDELSRQLGSADEKKAVLVIKCVFGEKTFYLSDLQSVRLEYPDGSVRDLTNDILRS